METLSALLVLCARNSAHNGQWRGAVKFTLIAVWSNRSADDFRRQRAHYAVTVMEVINSVAVQEESGRYIDGLLQESRNSSASCAT